MKRKYELHDRLEVRSTKSTNKQIGEKVRGGPGLTKSERGWDMSNAQTK